MDWLDVYQSINQILLLNFIAEIYFNIKRKQVVLPLYALILNSFGLTNLAICFALRNLGLFSIITASMNASVFLIVLFQYFYYKIKYVQVEII